MILKDILFGMLLTGLILIVILGIAQCAFPKHINADTIKKCVSLYECVWFYTSMCSLALSGGDICWSHWLGTERDLIITIPGFGTKMIVGSALFISQLALIHLFYWIEIGQKCYFDIPTETVIRSGLIVISILSFVMTSLWYREIAYSCAIPMALSCGLSMWVDRVHYRASECGMSVVIKPSLRQLLDFGYMVSICLLGCLLCA